MSDLLYTVVINDEVFECVDYSRPVWMKPSMTGLSSLFKQKAIWQEYKDKLMKDHGVDFQAFHRNDQPEKVRLVINNQYPAVVAQDETGQLSIFMNDLEISQCEKSPEKFINKIIERLANPLKT